MIKKLMGVVVLALLFSGVGLVFAQETKDINVSFSYNYPVDEAALYAPQGFTLYADGVSICGTTDGAIRTFDCMDVALAVGYRNFNLTATYPSGNESPPSATYQMYISGGIPPGPGDPPVPTDVNITVTVTINGESTVITN